MARGPDYRPALAFQLERAVKELGEAEGRYDRVSELDRAARNKKRDSLAAANESLRAAQQRMGRVAEEIASKESLYLYSMKQVDALLALLQWLDEHGRGRGCFRCAEVKCDDIFLASEMRHALRDLGLKETYELPPDRRAALMVDPAVSFLK